MLRIMSARDVRRVLNAEIERQKKNRETIKVEIAGMFARRAAARQPAGAAGRARLVAGRKESAMTKQLKKLRGAAIELVELLEWAQAHCQKINSAHELWMSSRKTRELKQLVERGGQVRARVFDPNGDFWGKLNRIAAQMKPHGWCLFDQEDNVDSGEAIFVKLR